MSIELENQSQEPQQAGTLDSVPDGSIFDAMPVIDENDEPIEAQELQEEESVEAGEKADEQKALEVSDELEIVIGDAKITGGEIKELLTLRENYTQQRQGDTEKVREIEQTALKQVSDKVQDYAAFTNEALRAAESIALGGYTRDQIKMMWRTDPDSAAILDARANQFDSLLSKANGQVQTWRKEYESFQEHQDAIKKKADQELAALETRKLFSQPWAQDVRRDQKKILSYANQHKIPAERLDSFMTTADGVKIVYQSMLYEQAQQRMKAGKQPQAQQASAPSSRPAARQAASTSSKALYDRATKGDKSARASWLSSAIPTI